MAETESVEKSKEIANIGLGEKMKGFLMNPVETFKKVKDENLESLLKYFVILALVFSILGAMMIAAGVSATPVNIPLMETYGGAFAVIFIATLIASIAGLFIGAAIIHIFVYLLGGKKGYTQTVKAVGYGMTPHLLLGWIPYIGIIFSIWALVVYILGIRELQEMSTGKAVLAVILPAIIIGIILGIYIAVSYPSIIQSYSIP